MYPSGFDGTTIQDLLQDVSLGNFHSQYISNGLVYFDDGDEDRAPNDKRTIDCANLFIFGVSFYWSEEKILCSSFHRIISSHFYLSKKIVQWLQPVPQNLGFEVSGAPTPIYEERQPTIDIIKENYLTIRVQQISVPIHYFH